MTTTSQQPSVAAVDQTPSAAVGVDPPVARSGGTIWPLLIRLHFYAGILIAPFLIVAAVTGLAYAVTPQIDDLLYGDKLHVSSTTGSVRPIDEQVRAARTAYPAGTIASVQTPADPEDTTRVVLNVDGLGEEKQRTVFVDPYTSKVKGELTTWYGATPVTTWLDIFHTNLHLGSFGNNYSEIAASWLWVIAGGGVLMWLGRGRNYRSGKRRYAVVPNLSVAKGVRRTRNFHASTGIWLLVGLFFLSATGLTWSNHAGVHFDSALDAVNAHRPELDTALPGAKEAAPAGHHATAEAAPPPAEVNPADIATVLATARTAGLSGPVEILAPADASSAWSATQTDNVWPVHKDAVAVDPATQKVTSRNDFGDWPFLAKVSALGIQAHMGILFGLINELLLVALVLGLLVVIFWGYRMWWQRRPTRAGRRRPVGTAPARGTWRRIPPLAGVVGVVVVAGLCWALPLFGWTLVAFLLTDLYIGEFQRQRDAATRELTQGQ